MRYILTADWHLRDDQPPCRTDHFVSAQARKIHYIFSVAEELECDGILIAGDIFHRARPSFGTLNLAIELLSHAPCPVFTIAGNHDLPAHSLSLMPNSAYGVLAAVGLISHCTDQVAPGMQDPIGASWEEVLPERRHTVAMAHTMLLPSAYAVFEGEPIAHFARRHKGYDLIVVGHHHETFIHQGKAGQSATVVSPGGITRQTADEDEKAPCIFTYDTILGTLTKHKLPCERGVISREHIDIVARKESRISQFVEMLGQQVGESGTNFETNLMTAVESPGVPRITKKMCIHALEGVPYVVGTADPESPEAEEESRTSNSSAGAQTSRIRTRIRGT